MSVQKPSSIEESNESFMPKDSETFIEDEECGKVDDKSDIMPSTPTIEISLEKIQEETDDSDEKPSLCVAIWKWWCGFYSNCSFMILVVVALLLARAYPPLGAVYVYPKITASYICLIFIFLAAGLGLKTKALKDAMTNVGFNTFVQLFSFGVSSSVVYGIATLIFKLGIISDALLEGMIICGCLSVSVNMVFVLAKIADGDEASAVFHAAIGNVIGVFLTPLLILLYSGKNANVDIGQTYLSLFYRVILPLFFGQLLQFFVASVAEFADKNKVAFKRVQEWALVFIIYTTFSKTFYNGHKGYTTAEIFIMVAMVVFDLCLLMAIAWYSLKLLFPSEPKLRVTGLFACTQKTVAAGVPLIQALFHDNPRIGLYTLPILVWYPMQLLIGTWLCPYLKAFVARDTERLKSEKITSDVSPRQVVGIQAQ